MKLNKNGWGIIAFLIFILVFVVCLIGSAIGLRRLGLLDENYSFVPFSEIAENREAMKAEREAKKAEREKKKAEEKARKEAEEKEKAEKERAAYSDIEDKMINAAKEYVNKYYENKLSEASLFLKVSTLKKYKYLDTIKDANNNECSGYVQVSKNDDESLSYTPYLKCKNYTTSGYEERKDD